jgi:uncharacterized membrane protein
MNIVRSGDDKNGDPYQDIRVRFDSGEKKNTETEMHVINNAGQKTNHLSVKDRIIVLENTGPNGDRIVSLVDIYRMPRILWIFGIFVGLVIFILGWKRGILSLLGLLWTLFVLIYFLLPKILAGASPFFVTSVAAIAIVFVSIFLAHGLKRRTFIAGLGTFISLLLAVALSFAVIKFTKLFGMGSEDAMLLLGIPGVSIDLSGILLSGILIGTLGVLDDVTTAQSAAVEELAQANPNFSAGELFKRAMSIGKEHIIALVNTLVLAYAGVALPVLLLLSIYQQPLWVTLSGEMMSEEIVRALLGSASLILAVPITTALAAFFVSPHKTPSSK